MYHVELFQHVPHDYVLPVFTGSLFWGPGGIVSIFKFSYIFFPICASICFFRSWIIISIEFAVACTVCV